MDNAATKKDIFKDIPAIAVGFIYCGLMAWLHYRQASVSVASDMPIYLYEIQGVDTGYSFPYPLFFGFSRLLSHVISIEAAVTTVLTVFNLISFFAVYIWLTVNMKLDRSRALIVTCLAYLVSMIFWPLNIHAESSWFNFRYLGVFTPNPYQNATYIATRPFAFLLFAKYYEIEGSSNKAVDYILLALWLLLSTLAKPSFVFVFLPVMGIATLVGVIKNKKGFGHLIKMFLAVIPTCVCLLFQFSSVFESSAETAGGIHLGFAVVWHLWTKGIKVAFIMANLFPLVFAILHIDTLKNERLLRYAWYTHIVGLLSFVMLYEGGPRMNDANFAWGYMHGLFFVFFASVYYLIKKLFVKGSHGSFRDYISLLSLVPHIVCGILFFIFVLEGGSVYTF